VITRPLQSDAATVLTGSCLICDRIAVVCRDQGAPDIEHACEDCRQDIEAFFEEPAALLTDLPDALRQAAAILQKASMPLICGLSDQSLEVQQAATRLARQCHAVIDWTRDNSAAALQHGLQDAGMVSCTFGEIQQRADLVIFWDCDAESGWPSFCERFVRGKKTQSIDWDRERQVRALRFLRSEPPCQQTDDAELRELQERIGAARYPVIVIDDGLPARLGNVGTLSLFRFVRRQNRWNHCRLVQLAKPGNAFGIQATLTALAGAPFGINFRDGRPAWREREYSVERLWSQGLIDALLLIGSPAQLAEANPPAQVPSIWICDRPNESYPATVTIRSSRWGLGCEGTGLRSDGVPVHRPARFECQLPNGVSVLEGVYKMLLQGIQESQ
jgi:formylmethanofuran dehydrogenase subunit B